MDLSRQISTTVERGVAAASTRASDGVLEATLGRPRGLATIFKAMAKQYVPAAGEGFAGDIAYELRGADGGVRAWSVHVTPAAATPSPGAVTAPALTLRLSLADFIRLSLGEVSPVTLVMGGRLELAGDFELAAKLGPMFGRPLPEAPPAG